VLKKRANISAVFLAGAIVAIVSMAITTLEAVVTMDIYLDPAYFAVWSKLMMPAEGPPPPVFYAANIIFSLIAGLIYSKVFVIVEEGIPGEGREKGLWYGVILFFVSGIPFLLTLYLLINLPVKFFIAGAVFGLVAYLADGLIIEYIINRAG
jgi:hypothetical protein